MIEAKNITKAT